jgi:anti-sigma B factor antagonist
MSTLEISVAAGHSGPVVTLAGEADIQGSAELSAVLAAQLSAGAVHLLVDIVDLSFADSTAVRALALTARALRDRGGTLVLLRPRPAVARVLELMGADQLMIVQGG